MRARGEIKNQKTSRAAAQQQHAQTIKTGAPPARGCPGAWAAGKGWPLLSLRQIDCPPARQLAHSRIRILLIPATGQHKMKDEKL